MSGQKKVGGRRTHFRLSSDRIAGALSPAENIFSCRATTTDNILLEHMPSRVTRMKIDFYWVINNICSSEIFFSSLPPSQSREKLLRVSVAVAMNDERNDSKCSTSANQRILVERVLLKCFSDFNFLRTSSMLSIPPSQTIMINVYIIFSLRS